MTVGDDALREIAANYTREPGVRQLERLLAKLLRKAATKLVSATVQPGLVIEAGNLRDYLGRPRFTPEAHERTSVPGVATGLAVTPVSAATCCSWRSAGGALARVREPAV